MKEGADYSLTCTIFQVGFSLKNSILHKRSTTQVWLKLNLELERRSIVFNLVHGLKMSLTLFSCGKLYVIEGLAQMQQTISFQSFQV
jgi:hypothetical protein